MGGAMKIVIVGPGAMGCLFAAFCPGRNPRNMRSGFWIKMQGGPPD